MMRKGGLLGWKRKRWAMLKRGNDRLFIDLLKLRLVTLRRRIFAWSRVIDAITKQPGVKMAMYRLSYDTAGTLVKASEWQALDISLFMQRLRARMGKRLLAYAWVAELQIRGVIHYHVCIVYRGYAPMPDRSYHSKDARKHWRSFNRMWEKGSSHTDLEVRSPYYMASYCKKAYQKDYLHFPMGAHAWAVWISDAGLKASLKWEALEDYKKAEIAHIMLDEGLGYVEAWEQWEWEVRRTRIIKQMMKADGRDVWEYVGSFNDISNLGYDGVTEELLSKRMMTLCTAHRAMGS